MRCKRADVKGRAKKTGREDDNATKNKITRVVIKQNTSQRGKEDEWMTVQNERTRRMSGTGRRD